jgi:hypothetical protein
LHPEVIEEGSMLFEKIPEGTESIRFVFRAGGSIYDFDIPLEN